MQTLKQALTQAITTNNLAATRAIVTRVHELNAELKASDDVVLTRFIAVDPDVAFKFCLEHYPEDVISLFVWRELPHDVVELELKKTLIDSNIHKLKIIANTILKFDFDERLLLPLRAIFEAREVLNSLKVADEFQKWLFKLEDSHGFLSLLFRSESRSAAQFENWMHQDPNVFQKHLPLIIQFINRSPANCQSWRWVQKILQDNVKLSAALTPDQKTELTRCCDEVESQSVAYPLASLEVASTVEPISKEGSQLLRHMLSQKDYQLPCNHEITLFTVPVIDPSHTPSSLKWLLRQAIEKKDPTRYKKYYDLLCRVNQHLADLGIIELDLKELFAPYVHDLNTPFNGVLPCGISFKDFMEKAEKLFFLLAMHPEFPAGLDDKDPLYKIIFNFVFYVMPNQAFDHFIIQFARLRVAAYGKASLIATVTRHCDDGTIYRWLLWYAMLSKTPVEEYNILFENFIRFFKLTKDNNLFNKNDLSNLACEIFRRYRHNVESIINASLHPATVGVRSIQKEGKNALLKELMEGPLSDEDRNLSIYKVTDYGIRDGVDSDIAAGRSYKPPRRIVLGYHYFNMGFDDATLLRVFKCYLDNSQPIIWSLNYRNTIDSCLEEFSEFQSSNVFSPEQKNRFAIAKQLNIILYYLTARIHTTSAEQSKCKIANAFINIVEFEATMNAPSIVQEFLLAIHNASMPGNNNVEPLQVDPKVINALKDGYKLAVHSVAQNNLARLQTTEKKLGEKCLATSSAANLTKTKEPASQQLSASSNLATTNASSSTEQLDYPPVAMPPVATVIAHGIFSSPGSTTTTPSPLSTPPQAPPVADHTVISTHEEAMQTLASLVPVGDELPTQNRENVRVREHS